MAGRWSLLLGIVGATLVSEDLTLVGIGVGVREGHLPLWSSVVAAAVGIFVGDVALLVAGRAGWRRLAAHATGDSSTRLARWIDAHPALAILGSRLLPGARVPMYVAAGALSRSPHVVIAWMLVASVLWTPMVVLAVSLGRDTFPAATDFHGARAWLGLIILAVCLAGLRSATRRAFRSPAQLPARLERARRWEYWPSWVVNAPVVAWVLLLAIRYRSLTLFTAANPAIEDGGFVGESKGAILDLLAGDGVLPALRVAAGPADERLAVARAGLKARDWTWPLVGKPDVGQRGMGVKWLSSEAEARAYLASVPHAVLLQRAHPGPYEAGLYYVREPGARTGRILGITDKHFPVVVGDGRTSVADLVRRHPRYRLQEALFARRLASRWPCVVPAGEAVVLGRVGNHAQGTEFRDGAHLWTPALDASLDAIAQRHPGIHLGRFDVRYADVDALRSGLDLAIVEFNGVAAEPTHIYDPSTPLVDAWRALAGHWSRAFAIGASCRAAGHPPLPWTALCRRVMDYLTSPAIALTSD